MKKTPFAFGSFALAATLGAIGSNVTACSSSSASSNTSSDAGGGQGSDAPPSGGDALGPDTWDNYAQAFFATYCVECHSATVPDPTTYPNQNFNIYSDVKGLVPTIRCGVAPAGQLQSGCPSSGFPPPGQFPIKDGKGTNPIPSDADRLRIIAWINAGAPEK